MKLRRTLAIVLLTLPLAAHATRRASVTAASLSGNQVYLGRLEHLADAGLKSGLFESTEPYQKWNSVEIPVEAREQEILFVRASQGQLLLVSQSTVESGGSPSVFVRAAGKKAKWEKKAEWKCTVLKSLRFQKGALTARCRVDDISEGSSEERTTKALKVRGFADGDFAVPSIEWKESERQLTLRKFEDSNAMFAEISFPRSAQGPLKVSAETLPK